MKVIEEAGGDYIGGLGKFQSSSVLFGIGRASPLWSDRGRWLKVNYIPAEGGGHTGTRNSCNCSQGLWKTSVL